MVLRRRRHRFEFKLLVFTVDVEFKLEYAIVNGGFISILMVFSFHF